MSFAQTFKKSATKKSAGTLAKVLYDSFGPTKIDGVLDDTSLTHFSLVSYFDRVIKAELEEESLGHLWTLDDPLTPLVYTTFTAVTEPVPTIGVAALLLIPANPATPFQPDAADEEQSTLRQRAEIKESTEFCKARKLILNLFPSSMHIGTSTIPSVPALRTLLLGKAKQVNPRSYLHQWEHFFDGV
ncbi:hypothetical protein HDV05_006056 [Chytridiales sp. JEL 0842]|nr:hypothetical protein HDV05_006056 [Chytridiales sp. JEL 0842]